MLSDLHHMTSSGYRPKFLALGVVTTCTAIIGLAPQSFAQQVSGQELSTHDILAQGTGTEHTEPGGKPGGPDADPSVGGPPASLPASAAGGRSFKQPYTAHLEPILKKIAASPDQRQKITAIVMAYKPKLQPLREQYNRKRDEFLKSLCDGKEPELLMSQQVELSHIYSDISSQYLYMRLEIRKFLKPQQITLMEEYRKQQGWR